MIFVFCTRLVHYIAGLKNSVANFSIDKGNTRGPKDNGTIGGLNLKLDCFEQEQKLDGWDRQFYCNAL